MPGTVYTYVYSYVIHTKLQRQISKVDEMNATSISSVFNFDFKDLTKPYVFSQLSQDSFEDNLSQKTIQFSLSSLLTQLMLIKVVIKLNFSETHCQKKSENKTDSRLTIARKPGVMSDWPSISSLVMPEEFKCFRPRITRLQTRQQGNKTRKI